MPLECRPRMDVCPATKDSDRALRIIEGDCLGLSYALPASPAPLDQIPEVDLQRRRRPGHEVEAGVPLSSLQTGDVGAGDRLGGSSQKGLPLYCPRKSFHSEGQ